MRTAIIGFATLYAALSAAALSLSGEQAHSILAFLWMFGPPACLVYGARYVVPFLVGTCAVWGLFYGSLRVKTTRRRIACILALLCVWSFFGWLAYAPGA